MKKIILTGGGTAGHVTPNLALIPTLRDLGYEIHYIGSYQGIERKLIEDAGVPYDGISSGKLRRYFTRYLIISETQALHGLRYMKIKNLHAIVQGKKRRRLTWWMNRAYFAK